MLYEIELIGAEPALPSGQHRQNGETVNRRNLWTAWAVIIGAAFAIVAISHARGFFYIVVAIIASAGYTVISQLTRKPPARTDQAVPPGPEARGRDPASQVRPFSGRSPGRPPAGFRLGDRGSRAPYWYLSYSAEGSLAMAMPPAAPPSGPQSDPDPDHFPPPDTDPQPDQQPPDPNPDPPRPDSSH